MEQAIGDQLLAYYGKRENGLFSMFTPTYDHITVYKSPKIQIYLISGEYTLSNSLYTSAQSIRYSPS